MRGAHLLLSGLVVLAPSWARAEPTRDEVMSGAERCAGIADNRAWLDCFYGSAQPMRAVLGLPPAPFAQTKLVPPAGASYGGAPATPVLDRKKPSSFLADMLGSDKPAAANMPMTSYRFSKDGRFTATLQNGEVFQQDENDTVRANWTKSAANYHVTVMPAADKFTFKVKEQPGAVFHVSRR